MSFGFHYDKRSCQCWSLGLLAILVWASLSEAFLHPTKRNIAFAGSFEVSSSSSCLVGSNYCKSTCGRLYQSSSVHSEAKTKSKLKKSKSNKKKKNAASIKSLLSKSNKHFVPGRSLSQEELTDHVSARYLSGRGGPLDDKVQRRGLVDETTTQSEFLRELNTRPALVLNADYQPLSYLPLSLWSWQDAIKAIFSGKVQVVDVYPEISIRAANLEVPLPSVIALTDYVAHIHQRPAFTRRNVFLRDEYKCQYCNDRFHTADLSLDHVHPRCMGGILNWENAVTSCLKCNNRKGSLPLSELRSVGMRLVREPKCPTQMELAAKAARMVPRRVHPTWKPYLGIAEKPNNGMPRKKLQGDEEFIDDRYFEESE